MTTMKPSVLVTQSANNTMTTVFNSEGQFDLVHLTYCVISKPITMQEVFTVNQNIDFSRLPTYRVDNSPPFQLLLSQIILSFFVDFIPNLRLICHLGINDPNNFLIATVIPSTRRSRANNPARINPY